MFTELTPEQTGVVTTNHYADPKMWGERFRESEVGAIGTGIAIGDYDGDGRPDIFVVSKTESCRLFRNLGGFKFEDVTEKAGVGDHGADAAVWKQGATWVDVNNDGRLDLYVCRFHAPNLLYINQGDGTFKEMAHAYGLDVNDASVMAAFCDYDRDGWLDVFVQTNLLDANAHPAGQKNYLFHNNRNGTFTNVTAPAGIAGEAQGHSATWWDFDEDGWPDLYVANDFAVPDKLYHNNRDGTFTDVINAVVPHMPYSSMGSDFGDVNNDGHLDLLACDMAATTHEKDQRGMADSRGRTTEDGRNPRAAPQYERNALYLNTGAGRCLEAAQLAGIAATDWTWSPRFEDLDNDGRIDLFVTNGMHRESTNLDLFARQMLAETPGDRVRVMRNSPVLAETHLAFRNRGDLQFENVSAAWGLNQRGVSFGSAFADLDGDGDLDLVYANYEKGVTILRNDCDQGHSVVFELRGLSAPLKALSPSKGTQSNRYGVGATVRIETAAGRQVRTLVLARGVLSNSEPILHFGLGDDTVIRRLTVEWPSGIVQEFENLAVDRRFTITEPEKTPPSPRPAPSARQFEEIGGEIGLAVPAREDAMDELSAQPLLPVRLGRRGPALAVEETDAAGNEEIVIGGTTLDPLRVLRNGAPTVIAPPGPVDDGPVLLFDADGDGKNDLLVTKGGNALPSGSAEYQPKLFVGDGLGGFHAAPEGTLPAFLGSAGAAAAADFDHDGKLDVFVGGRVTNGQYPLPARSALWRNRGGSFEDVTDTLAPALREIGMVTAALWTDVDNDGWPDLLVALEWGNVKCFHNRQGTGFEDWTEKLGFAAAGTGWWTSLAAADFNGDGRMDYVVGNVGLNTSYRADAAHPALLFYGDFRGNGEEPQLVEAYYEDDRLYPRQSRRALSAAIPEVLKRFPSNNAYAHATLGEILGDAPLAAAQRFAATELRSGVFLSQPDGTYRFAPLPRIAQIAPLQGIVAGDFDGDGFTDIYAVQNSYGPIPAVGRFDGGLSQWLRGDGQGHFSAVPVAESGLLVPGDAKALVIIDFNHDGWPDFVVSRNNDTTLAFRNRGVDGRQSRRITLRGAAGNPAAIGARITVELAKGGTQTSEVAAGSGYYSQSTASVFFGFPTDNPPRQITVRWPDGKVTRHSPEPTGTEYFLRRE
jgi:hypothetical protein